MTRNRCLLGVSKAFSSKMSTFRFLVKFLPHQIPFCSYADSNVANKLHVRQWKLLRRGQILVREKLVEKISRAADSPRRSISSFERYFRASKKLGCEMSKKGPHSYTLETGRQPFLEHLFTFCRGRFMREEVEISR